VRDEASDHEEVEFVAEVSGSITGAHPVDTDGKSAVGVRAETR